MTVRTKTAKRRAPAPKKDADVFPMRINKYLALQNYATRRGADELIEKGFVTINGKRAKLGDIVHEKDEVAVKSSAPKKNYVYFAYNKPRGIVTHGAQGHEEEIGEVVEKVPELRGTFPVGRLDKDSHGLIILTNDGRVTDRLLNPKFDHDKEYEVMVHKPLRNNFKERMESGVNIEGYLTKECHVDVVGAMKFRVTLHEGKRHQIRRMVAALYNTVADIKRVRVLNIKLGKTPSGGFAAIKGDDLKIFLQKLGLER